METTDDSMPDRDDAHRMLDAARAAEGQTRNPPLPRVFFALQAALLAAVCGAQVLPAGPSLVVTIIGLVAVVGVGVRWVFMRPGYGIVWPDGQAGFPYLLAMFVLVGVPAVLAVGFEVPWLWLVAGVLAAATTLAMGHRYREAFGG